MFWDWSFETGIKLVFINKFCVFRIFSLCFKFFTYKLHCSGCLYQRHFLNNFNSTFLKASHSNSHESMINFLKETTQSMQGYFDGPRLDCDCIEEQSRTLWPSF